MSQVDRSKPLTRNTHLVRWVEKIAALTEPSAIHWVDGSQDDYVRLCREMVATGTLTRLDETRWPGCFYARSDPGDVARVEDRTFICSLSRDAAGPMAALAFVLDERLDRPCERQRIILAVVGARGRTCRPRKREERRDGGRHDHGAKCRHGLPRARPTTCRSAARDLSRS